MNPSSLPPERDGRTVDVSGQDLVPLAGSPSRVPFHADAGPAGPQAGTSYADFVAQKSRTVAAHPVPFDRLAGHLYPHQRDLVGWALRRGRAAIFADTGLGKTAIQVEWARHVAQQGRVLILAPLAVAEQTVREAARFGVAIEYARADSGAPIVITNYEMLHAFDASAFAGVVLDECFAAGTPIERPDGGSTPIEAVRVGDAIVNAVGIDHVSDIHRREVPYAVRVTVGHRAIVCSPNHPFFTQRGWVSARDLEPGDRAMETAAAVRLVRGDHRAEVEPGGAQALLRSVLLSEVADASAGDPGEDPHAGGGNEAGRDAEGLVRGRLAGGRGPEEADRRPQSDGEPGGAREALHPLEDHEARTFRAWGEWSRFDAAAGDLAGCTRHRLDGGICFVTGPTDSGLSHALQARLGASRAASRYRGGWTLASEPEGTRREEGREAGFARVDRLEVLELGHPDLERLRAPDGKLYFYDLGGTRHPSFSVAGLLVHNSSILKAYDGKTRTQIIEAFGATPWRLACTATPAPNDFTELGNHSEFLGIRSRTEMLAEYFTHDGGETQVWRLKGHAEESFWRWVCSWGAVVKRPSDLGHPDDGFALPELRMHERVIAVDHSTAQKAGMLFADEVRTLADQRATRRATLEARVAAAAELCAGTDPVLVWCELNDEADAITAAVPDAVQVAGADDLEVKKERLLGFAEGRYRVLVTKMSIASHGLNLQRCARMVFAGVSHSYEQTYQAIRRCWRFGQKRPVDVYMIRAETEGAVIANLKRKELDAERLAAEMVDRMRDTLRAEILSVRREWNEYTPVRIDVPPWIRSHT
jgi:superfamily II DNA or RNA helicase